MTLSARKLFLATALAMASTGVAAAPAPEAEMAAAQAAIASAERARPRGTAGETLAAARDLLAQAQAALERRKHRDALRLAEHATVVADLARARAVRVNAQIEVDEKTARNVELRRQMLVVPGAGR